MRNKKKSKPLWIVLAIDLLIIAVYVGGFYIAYYRVPRQLDSANIQTVAASQSGSNEIINQESDELVSKDTVSDKTVSDETSTEEVVSTDTSYTSENISIHVEQYTQGTGKDTITYYVADVYLKEITSLQSGFADNTYGVGYTDTVLEMDEDLAAILAINGDYYGNGNNGVVIRNGVVYRDNSSGLDVCVLYSDGTMKTYSADEFDAERAVKEGAWQAWCFGPELLDESGNSMTSFTTDSHIAKTNPRSAIGYYEPGHYCFVVVDGRQSGYSKGMTLVELSQLMKELGCTAAYNLDGGKSSAMTFHDVEVNRPCDGGREVSDCILIKEVE